VAIGKAANGVIDPAGDSDFFSVPVKKDQFVRFFTQANPDDDPAKIDTVITLYDDKNQKIAEADDSVPRASTDSELYYRAPADGTICIKVEEFSTWHKDPQKKGGPTFTYKVATTLMSDTGGGNNRDKEPNNDGSTAQAINSLKASQGSSTFAYLYGMLDPQADVDVYSFTLAPGTLSASIYFPPFGPDGYGNTTSVGVVRLTDKQGKAIGLLDVTKGSDNMSIPLAAGTEALLWVTRPAGAPLGSNDFYFLKHFSFDTENQKEAEATTGSNETAATAETITIQAPTPPSKVKSGYVLGFVKAAGDVDYFKFAAAAGDKLTVACGAIRSGSGLTAPVFEVRDPSDVSLQSETETDAKDVLWSDTPGASKAGLTIATAGNYHLKVTAGGQDPNVSSNFYRCGLHLTPP
jgi:hypothetical protein